MNQFIYYYKIKNFFFVLLGYISKILKVLGIFIIIYIIFNDSNYKFMWRENTVFYNLYLLNYLLFFYFSILLIKYFFEKKKNGYFLTLLINFIIGGVALSFIFSSGEIITYFRIISLVKIHNDNELLQKLAILCIKYNIFFEDTKLILLSPIVDNYFELEKQVLILKYGENYIKTINFVIFMRNCFSFITNYYLYFIFLIIIFCFICLFIYSLAKAFNNDIKYSLRHYESPSDRRIE